MRLAASLFTTAFLLFAMGTVVADEGRPPAKTDDIKLLPLKAADVEKVVAAHKGKVVVLDVWAEF